MRPPSCDLPHAICLMRSASWAADDGRQDRRVEAGAVAGVAGAAADLVHTDEQRVAVAVQGDRLHPLLRAGGVALDPVLLPAARPVGAAPGGEGAVQRLVVHPTD